MPRTGSLIGKSLLAGCLLGAATASHAALPVDDVKALPAVPSVKNRVYVGDFAINHIIAGRLTFYDADTGRFLGVLGTGFAGQFSQSPDRREIYVATTYLSRGQRGERTDVLEVWDADTLAFKYEVALDAKRAQALNYRGYLRTSADGRLVFVQNATPATSVSIVDLQARRIVGEIESPGCWGVYPAAGNPRRFSQLCGDGTVATFTLNDDGTPRSGGRANSDKVFDPHGDALFIHGEQERDTYRFVTFTGNYMAMDFGAEKARKLESWSLLDAEGRKGRWRPGGYQVLAYHPPSGRMYVGMHAGGREGSHKLPASQIWVYDVASRKRVARLPGDGAISLTVPSTPDRMLYVIDGLTNSLVVRGGPNMQVRHRQTPLGDSPALLEAR